MTDKIPKILFVEDDENDSRLFRRALRKTIFVGSDSTLVYHRWLKQAIPAVIHGNFDIVVTDMNLPDSSGVDTVGAILEVAECPVLVVSHIGDRRTSDQAVKMGAADYIEKPVQPDDLEVKIRYCLSRHSVHASHCKHIEERAVERAHEAVKMQNRALAKLVQRAAEETDLAKIKLYLEEITILLE